MNNSTNTSTDVPLKTSFNKKFNNIVLKYPRMSGATMVMGYLLFLGVSVTHCNNPDDHVFRAIPLGSKSWIQPDMVSGRTYWKNSKSSSQI